MDGLTNNGHTVERRHQPAPADADELLQLLPARALLDRMPAPAIGIGRDGAFVYANWACASMLGFVDVATLLEQSLLSLLAADSLRSSDDDCMVMLRDAGTKVVVEWRHADGFPIHTTVSSLLLRATDPVLVVYLHDVTELLWA